MPIEYLEKIPGKEWLLVRTMPRSEKLAEAFFRANGIACYLPKYNKTYINSFTAKSGKSYSYKRQSVLSVMFPGYIFAALDLEDISNTRRERSVAQVCVRATGSEDELLADLRKVQEFEFLALTNRVEVKAEIQAGSSVTITRGPLSGWTGVVEKRMDQNMIFVRIESIGYSLGVEIPAVDCETVV
ncbi:MAG: hypothetical protein IJC34_01750 [Lentisphaeria bacterium]|nr:hypothetical protein [Lentisphaeria bacterium]